MASEKTSQSQRAVERATAKSRARSAAEAAAAAGEKAPNPVWFKPLMFGFMLTGLAWLLVYYISNSAWPVPALQNWNILVGIGIMLIGFFMTTRWR